jgi:hypothetical protein|tara:strand:+ start:247 stop:390 length:144 start_codon:yes stop_codon:yes gene_type:complete
MKDILDYLINNDLKGVSNNVDIAKGKHEIVTDWNEIKDKIARLWKKK